MARGTVQLSHTALEVDEAIDRSQKNEDEIAQLKREILLLQGINAPFKIYSTYEEIGEDGWYYIRANPTAEGTYFLERSSTNDVTFIGVKKTGNAGDAQKWGFVGFTGGFYIYNKAAGHSHVLIGVTSSNTTPKMAPIANNGATGQICVWNIVPAGVAVSRANIKSSPNSAILPAFSLQTFIGNQVLYLNKNGAHNNTYATYGQRDGGSTLVLEKDETVVQH